MKPHMFASWPARLPMVAIAAYLVAIPALSPWLSDAAPFDTSRLLQVLLLAVCTLALARQARHSLRLPVALLALLSLAILSAAMAPRPDMAAREIALFIGLSALAWAVADAAEDDFLVWSIVLATALYAALVLVLGWGTYASGMAIAREELFIGYPNRRLYNHVQTVAIPLCVWIASTSQRRLLSGLAWTAIALSFATLALSAGRATALALLGGLAATWITLGPTASRVARILAKAALVGVALHALIFIAWPLLLNVELATNVDLSMARLTSDQSRLRLWAWAWEAWASSPWLGIGPMHLANRFNGVAAHPHNLPLQLLAEWGVFAAAVVAYLAIRSGAALIRQARNDARGAGLVFMVYAVAIDACFSGNASLPLSQVWIAIGLGMAWRFTRSNNQTCIDPMPGSKPAWGQATLRTVVIVAPLALAFDTAMSWNGLEQTMLQALVEFPSLRLNPRFWSHGWF